MDKYVIFSDPGCGLSSEEAESLGIKILPYVVNVGEKSYTTTLKWDNFSELEFLSIMKKKVPLSFSRPPLGDWMKMVEECFKEGFDVLYVGMSQKLTGSENSLLLIYKTLKEKYPERELITIDTLTVARAMSFYVEKASENLKNNLSIYKNAENIKSLLGSTESFIVPQNPMFFKMSNRGDASTLDNLKKLTVLKSAEDGSFIPDQSFKTLDDVINHASSLNGKFEIGFTADFSEKKINLIAKRFRDPKILHGVTPFTAQMCGWNTVEITIINV